MTVCAYTGPSETAGSFPKILSLALACARSLLSLSVSLHSLSLHFHSLILCLSLVLSISSPVLRSVPLSLALSLPRSLAPKKRDGNLSSPSPVKIMSAAARALSVAPAGGACVRESVCACTRARARAYLCVCERFPPAGACRRHTHAGFLAS